MHGRPEVSPNLPRSMLEDQRALVLLDEANDRVAERNVSPLQRLHQRWQIVGPCGHFASIHPDPLRWVLVAASTRQRPVSKLSRTARPGAASGFEAPQDHAELRRTARAEQPPARGGETVVLKLDR